MQDRDRGQNIIDPGTLCLYATAFGNLRSCVSSDDSRVNEQRQAQREWRLTANKEPMESNVNSSTQRRTSPLQYNSSSVVTAQAVDLTMEVLSLENALLSNKKNRRCSYSRSGFGPKNVGSFRSRYYRAISPEIAKCLVSHTEQLKHRCRGERKDGLDRSDTIISAENPRTRYRITVALPKVSERL